MASGGVYSSTSSVASSLRPSTLPPPASIASANTSGNTLATISTTATAINPSHHHTSVSAPSSPSTVPSQVNPADMNSRVRLSLVPYSDPTRSQPSAAFDQIDKSLGEGHVLKIGRQVKPSNNGNEAAGAGSNPPAIQTNAGGPGAAAGDSPVTPLSNPPLADPSGTTPVDTQSSVLLSTAVANLTLRSPPSPSTSPSSPAVPPAGTTATNPPPAIGSNAAATPVETPSSPLLGGANAGASVTSGNGGANGTLTPIEKLPPLPGKSVDYAWFKSKVVSRNHAEMWLRDGQIYLRDTGSSSGTFLNRMRLSPSGKISRPYPLRDGDVIQLGIDYQGRPEDIYKCVIIKVCITSMPSSMSQRKKENPIRFRNALKALLNATNPYSSSKPNDPASASAAPTSPTTTTSAAAAAAAASNASVDCCICLCAIGPYQALFLSPCSHCYHHKCVRNLLDTPMFQCPMCRQVANLDASVSMESLVDGLAGHDAAAGGMDARIGSGLDEYGYRQGEDEDDVVEVVHADGAENAGAEAGGEAATNGEGAADYSTRAGSAARWGGIPNGGPTSIAPTSAEEEPTDISCGNLSGQRQEAKHGSKEDGIQGDAAHAASRSGDAEARRNQQRGRTQGAAVPGGATVVP
ncbi:hypothetical protein HDU96_002132 [Phlyctochytrium bullatum]|nr:hypothetical protein HDU96_002132 [Phlyctochytrium bullatum]